MQLSGALGALLVAKELEDPLRPEGMDCITPVVVVTLMQMSPQAVIPAGTLSFAHITPQLLQPILPKILQVASVPFVTWLQAPSKGGTASFSDELLHLQKKMNVALDQLLANRSTKDFCCRELELNMEFASCLNDV